MEEELDSNHPHRQDTVFEDANPVDFFVSDADRIGLALCGTEDEIIDRLKRNDIDLGTAKSRSDFLERYIDPLSPTETSRPDERRPNVLHRIAALGRTVDSTPLVQLLLREFPSLAKGQDEEGKTALHVALYTKNTDVAQVILDALEAVDEIISVQDDKGMNCIHVAIAAGIPHSLVLDLIRRAPGTVFREQNNRGLTPLHEAVRYDRCKSEQVEVVEELLRRDHDALSIVSGSTSLPDASIKKGLAPYQYHLEPKTIKGRFFPFAPWRKTTASSQMPNSSYATQIKDMLRLWILRTRSEDDARGLLYGSGSAGKPAARSDALFVFGWLRSKGVKRVIKVVVKDLTAPPHTEESIEKALWGLQVELLDWQRVDICPTVVRSVGESLEGLVLYWSGNNAVLRGWSEPEGLPRLTNLKWIDLTMNPENSERVQRNLASFEARVAALNPGIKINRTTATYQLQGSANVESLTDAGPRGTEEWLRHIVEFGHFLDKVGEQGIPRPELRHLIVRVALLDSGVDLLADSVRGRIHSKTHYFKGDTRHGTHMAATILSVCPQVELHFFEVDLLASSSSVSRDATHSIVRACEDVVRASPSIDIVCIPWTIRIEDDDDAANDKIHILRYALKKVLEADIAIMCPYPEHHQDVFEVTRSLIRGSREVTKIAAVTKSPFQPDLPNMGEIFYFPGEDMITTRSDNSKFVSGKAVATATAAGLAATILRCRRLVEGNRILRPDWAAILEDNSDSGRENRHEFLAKAFSVMSRGTSKQEPLMPVWDIFKLPTGIMSSRGVLDLDLDANMSFLSHLVERLGG
ncbi:hypothetical protein B0T14DRAFT_599241 [Immersiella caudata]|uniref:Peptidase S8/S53 domain-containing protein n=1 Tax=Immersiella caudata TaxID=314043 RepID=A0AA39XIX5_9PEZI|nr:hypothetical protein B0T14DRAFT_599241 [Immersiella caudata]